MAAVIAGAGHGHVDGYRRNPFSPFPGSYTVFMPGDLRAIENEFGMVNHAGHRKALPEGSK